VFRPAASKRFATDALPSAEHSRSVGKWHHGGFRLSPLKGFLCRESRSQPCVLFLGPMTGTRTSPATEGRTFRLKEMPAFRLLRRGNCSHSARTTLSEGRVMRWLMATNRGPPRTDRDLPRTGTGMRGHGSKGQKRKKAFMEWTLSVTESTTGFQFMLSDTRRGQ